MLNLVDAGLKEFPFAVVAPREPTSFWADREEFRNSLQNLANSWAYNKNSTIYMMWADFGAGKTHALRYLQYLAQQSQPLVLAIYCDLPEALPNFKAVYEQIIPKIPERLLKDAIQKYRYKYKDEWLSTTQFEGDRDALQALWFMSQMSEQPQGDVSRKWLRGLNLSNTEKRNIDYINPIKESTQAIHTLSTICKLVTEFTEYTKIIFMLDEFQRIGQSSTKRIVEVNAGIRSLFNACPQNISILLTYSIGIPENIKFFVTKEVSSCITRMFNLKALSPLEAQKFIKDVLQFKSASNEPCKLFSDKAIGLIANRLAKKNDNKLTPRKTMLAFSNILNTMISNCETYELPIDEMTIDTLYEDPVEVNY